MEKLTDKQLTRLNLNSMFNANAIGSELTWQVNDKELTGIIVGIRLHNESLVYQVSVKTDKGKSVMKAVNPTDIGISLLTDKDSDNIALLTETANNASECLNDGLPLAVNASRALPKAFGFDGTELKAMRLAKGLTQVAVALALGMSKGSAAAIGDWESDRINVPVKHQAKLISLYKPIADTDTDTKTE